MKAQYGYALTHRANIVAARAHDEPGFVYCIYTRFKDARRAQREAPQCAIQRVRIIESEKGRNE